jgi:hypothetical protein
MESQGLGRSPHRRKHYCSRFGNVRLWLKEFRLLHVGYFDELYPQVRMLADTRYTSVNFALDAKLKRMTSICYFFALLLALLGLLILGTLGLKL